MTEDSKLLDHERWFLDMESDAVPGFLTQASAQMISLLLRHQLEQDIVGSLAEIGTYKGKTFVGMLKASRDGERVVGFDLFPPDVEQGFRQALTLVDPSLGQRAVAVRRDTRTLRVAEWMNLLATPARFVHIDGGHTHDAVLADLKLTGAFLHDRAIVIFDDFLHDWYPDLTEGILAGLRASVDLAPVAIIPRVGHSRLGGTKLVCSTRSSAESYRSLLGNAFSKMGPTLRTLAGNPVLAFQGF